MNSIFGTLEETQRHFDKRAELYNRRDFDGILNGLSEDIEIHYCDLPVIHGRSEYEKILNDRFSKIIHYDLKKIVRFINGNFICNDLEIDVLTTASDRKQVKRAIELLTYDDDARIRKWEMVANDWPEGLSSRMIR